MTKNIYTHRVRNQQIILREDWPDRVGWQSLKSIYI